MRLDAAYLLTYQKLSDADCTTLAFGERKEKAEVQRRFDLDQGDFIARIGDGTVQVHGKVPSLQECIIRSCTAALGGVLAPRSGIT